MVVGISIDLGDLIKDTIKFFKRRKAEKIPVGQFIKKIEERYNIKLSKESKDEILYTLEDEGIIKLVKSRYGKKYVILGDLI